MRHMTSPEAIWRGALAGAFGTVAMDIYWYMRYRAQDGQQHPLAWEFTGPSSWDSVSAPAQVGRRLYQGLLRRPLDERWARVTNNVMHWGYGMACGAAFGVVAGSLSRSRLTDGPAFGATVWAGSYVTLPILGLYKPIWQYSLRELTPDLTAHLIYGTTAACVLRLRPGSRVRK